MVFSEPSFLFLFLPLLLAAYFVVPKRLRNTVLLAGSLAFYSWGEALWVGVMLGSVAFNFLMGVAIARCRDSCQLKKASRRMLAIAVTGNLVALIVFKYANFIAENLDLLLARVGLAQIELSAVHLPIGISFFTFQAMSYVIDVYRGDAPVQRNPLKLALYISLFPQLIAGPIVRYAAVAEQISKRVISPGKFAEGVERFTIGLSKKMMLANPVGMRADAIFALSAGDLSPSIAWLGALCYTLQIYFDFSGYSDMAIGLGKMFGFEFAENFNYPYVSRSITEFWRRWHISLSSWFRDYLYIPLGGNRVASARVYGNLLLVFVLCGFWHGASWNFLIWGLFHGGLLVVERLGLGAALKRLSPILRHVYVLLAVMIGWVFFRAETLPESLSFLRAMTGFGAPALNAQPLGFFLDLEIMVVLCLGFVGSTPILPVARDWIRGRVPAALMDWLAVGSVGALLPGCALLMAAGAYNPFIYYRF